MKTYLAVMLGGAAGTGMRMWLSGSITAWYGEAFPLGTLVVNVFGSFVIGVCAALVGPEGMLFTSLLARQVVMVGVLGGFTTFSAFSLQTFDLASGGEWMRAGLNVILSVAMCLLAVWFGHLLGTVLMHGTRS